MRSVHRHVANSASASRSNEAARGVCVSTFASRTGGQASLSSRRSAQPRPVLTATPFSGVSNSEACRGRVRAEPLPQRERRAPRTGFRATPLLALAPFRTASTNTSATRPGTFSRAAAASTHMARIATRVDSARPYAAMPTRGESCSIGGTKPAPPTGLTTIKSIRSYQRLHNGS